jgi:predicted DNA-binding mobile mystery protein A
MKTLSRFNDMRRVQLDRQLADAHAAIAGLRAPKAGWVHTIRTALGMTSRQLAARVGIAQPTLSLLEKSEADGRIQLDSLARIADALDCELVYALVPRRPLSDTVTARLDDIAEARYRRTAHSMALEDQLDESSRAIRDAKVAAIRERIRPGELWQDE